MGRFFSTFQVDSHIKRKKTDGDGSENQGNSNKKKFSPVLHAVYLLVLGGMFFLSFHFLTSLSETLYHDYFDYDIPVTARPLFILLSHILLFLFAGMITCHKLSAGLRDVVRI